MGSRGIASLNKAGPGRKPSRKSLPTPFVQAFRAQMSIAMATVDPGSGKRLGNCIGIYCFFDYDGEPIYVGQTTRSFTDRIGRHLTGQRSDTVAYRILDPFEVAEMQLWPMTFDKNTPKLERARAVDQAEYSVYEWAVRTSEFKAILNEKLPLGVPDVDMPAVTRRFNLVPEDLRGEREHPDVRIARRAETLARLTAVAHERGEVSDGLRRVIVIQAIRIAYLAAKRLAFAEGDRDAPPASAIDMAALVGRRLAAGAVSIADLEDGADDAISQSAPDEAAEQTAAE